MLSLSDKPATQKRKVDWVPCCSCYRLGYVLSLSECLRWLCPLTHAWEISLLKSQSCEEDPKSPAMQGFNGRHTDGFPLPVLAVSLS